MKRAIFMLVCISWLFSLGISNLYANEPVVKIVGDPWPPWMQQEKGKEPSGYAVEIAQELFKRLNLNIDIRIVPFKRGLAKIKYGEADAILMVAKNKERSQYMLFKTPMKETLFHLYHTEKLKNFKWGNWQDLQPYKIGIVGGFNYGKDWDKARKKYSYKTFEVTKDIQNIGKLLNGRVDLIILEKSNAIALFKDNLKFKNQLRPANKPVFEATTHLGISKKSFLATKINLIHETLQKMKKDGTYARLLKDKK